MVKILKKKGNYREIIVKILWKYCEILILNDKKILLKEYLFLINRIGKKSKKKVTAYS